MPASRNNQVRLIVAATLLVVLLTGIGIGLLLSQLILPHSRYGADIASLSSREKEKYVVLVGAAYSQNHDLTKAEEQLDQLGLPNSRQWVSELAERYIADEMPAADIQALAELAHGLGAMDRDVMAFIPTATPTDTQTPTLTPTPAATETNTPTATPIPPTQTPSPIPPTETAMPTSTSTSTATPEPTDTPLPPTNTPRPAPSNTPRPPTPTRPPVPLWSYTARLIGPNEPPQGCNTGNLQIRVTVQNADGAQIPGIWIYDYYSKLYQVTGNVSSADWGPGETMFEYGIGGGGRLCIGQGQGGDCVSDFTRDLPCYYSPPVEDLYASGYCDVCCDRGISLEGCRQRIAEGSCFETGAGHYSWHVIFQRGW